ncbi:MAG: efflux RND transporter permease subunit [Bacteroidia bacterium]|nr:efflux RND transporter permease subunit [Bacteroidia bacterium]
MFSKFLHRPVFAIVISILLVFLGLLSIKTTPTSQFPDIAPPMVVVRASYPGASAKVLTESVLAPLEQAINGVPGMRYMLSDATSSGEANIRVVFHLGTDPGDAVVNVNNRVMAVLNRLPILVQREGVIVTPLIPSMLLNINIYSKDPKANMRYLFNYAYVKLLPELQRINGIGQGVMLGSRQYAMRVWLKPDRMRAYNVSPEEVMEALSEQSIIGSPGRIGRADGIQSQSLEYVLTYIGRFNKPEQYQDVVIRSNNKGELLKLKDIADVELGSEYYDIYSNISIEGKNYPCATIVLRQAYGSNASETIKEVKKKLDELKKDFPPGMEYELTYDVSKFLNASISSVMDTLRDAFILVALVVLLFLGDWRSTLVPIIAVPVSLIGAFLFVNIFGLTINMITLFSIVLAIGIVVDDAIVVVEAIHAKMENNPKISIFKAVQLVLGEITGAIIAITLVMASVFIPVGFMSGPVGIFYRQFSVTMASSIILSGLVALTLTPVLSAMILKRLDHHGHPKGWWGKFIHAFNTWFQGLTDRYVSLLEKIVPKRWLTILFLLIFIAGIVLVNYKMPSGFIPGEDQGIIYVIIQTPPGSTLERTNQISRRLQDIISKIPEVQSVASYAGWEVLTDGRGSNAGTCMINLKPWEERSKTVKEIIEELKEKVKDFPGATIEFFEPPSVPGYGNAGGFSLQLLDKTNTGDYKALEKVTNDFLEELKKRKEITGLFTFYSANYPQYEIIIDNNVAMQKGVTINDIMNTLSIYIGSTYELGFIKYQWYFKVFVQAHPKYRSIPTDLNDIYIKNKYDKMVPLSSLVKIRKYQDANEINRYNLYPTASIRGEPARGYSSGEVIDIIKELAAQKLPRGYSIDWSFLSKDEAERGNEALFIFIIVVIFVYLVLAAQYESFILPFSVIVSLLPGIMGALFAVRAMGLENDIYTQVSLIMLIGLLGKNAILIVEFANQKHHLEKMSVLQAALEGARLRFRPIVMTSFAFIAGLIPLALAHGAGAVGNKTIGWASLGGMLFGTVLGVIVNPGLYYIFGKMAEGKQLIKREEETALSEAFAHSVDTFPVDEDEDENEDKDSNNKN